MYERIDDDSSVDDEDTHEGNDSLMPGYNVPL